MPVATIGEAAVNLNQLVDAAVAGETVIILRDGVPVARIEQIARPAATATNMFGQNFGLWAGLGKSPDWAAWKQADVEIEADFEKSIARSV